MRFSLSSRKGLSTIVGGLLFTILMIAGFSVMSLALDAQTDIVNTQRMMSDVELKKQQENFAVAAYTDASENLQISVNNKGQNPLEISSIWIINKTLSEQPATRYSINPDDAIISPGFTSEIIGSQNLNITPDTYDVKIVSTLGTIEITELANGGTAPSSGALRAEMITDPPDVIIGQNVTVALVVTNSGPNLIENVIPDPLTVNGAGNIVTSSSHSPSTVDLNKGESVMFTWDYTVNGNSGDDLIFSTKARGDDVVDGLVVSNTVSDVSILREPTDGGSGSFDPDIVNDDLIAKPQIFLIVPSSQGESNDVEALWGINVVNPINAPMEVSKVIIAAFAPGANSNDQVFDRGGGSCQFQQIQPTYVGPDDEWICPSENSLMWQNSQNPIIIPGNSSASFLTKVEPGKPSGNIGLETILVQGSVFTTLGSFGKSGYQSTMSDTSASIANVFLTDDVNLPRDNANIQSQRLGIIPSSNQTFNVALADMDFDDNTLINATARLIINIPSGWKVDQSSISAPGFTSPTVTIFGDKSSQIVAETLNPIGSATNIADTITFTAQAPDISYDRLYVMFVLAQGVTSNGFSIGPLSEIVLQVDAS